MISASDSTPVRPNGREQLRVALVSSQRGWHGGEEQAALLARGIRDRGHTCLIVARQGGAVAERMAAEGFNVATFAGRGRGPLDIWRIRRHLLQTRPDVLHMNDPHALTSAGLASLGLDIPARVASRRVCFPVHAAVRYRFLCDRVLCVCDSVVEVCRKSGIPTHQLQLVYDGVDPARLRLADRLRGRHALGLRDDQLLLLTVATLTDCKGHRYLLDAMPAVLRRHPYVCLALAGDGELAEPLRRQADQLGIAGKVRFLGYRHDIPDLITAADLFVLPSHTEGCCNAIIEAMMAARPIVTTNAGGIRDLVAGEPGERPVAWMVRPRDSNTLAVALLDALGSPQLWPELGYRARDRATKLFTSDHMVDATLSAYREVLAEPAARRQSA